MKIFADTHYFVGLLNERDQAHEASVRWQGAYHIRALVTTSWVLVELADSMSLPEERMVTAEFIQRIKSAPHIRVVPATEELLWRGFHLYQSRKDKGWSLTDCISFIVMSDEGLTEALTGDRHFEQAGFTALLLN